MAKDMQDRICATPRCYCRADIRKGHNFYCGNHAPSDWTKERVALALKRQAEGVSASEIASELGGVTRNAVIGKLHRLGVYCNRSAQALTEGRRLTTKRAHGTLKAKRGRPARASSTQPSTGRGRSDGSRLALLLGAKGSRAAFEVGTLPDITDTLTHANAKPLTLRGSCECAWPLQATTDTADAETLFCCDPVVPESPYCAAHHARAYKGRISQQELIRSVRRYA